LNGPITPKTLPRGTSKPEGNRTWHRGAARLALAHGAPLVGGNAVRLLKDGSENYPAWLDAADAEHHINFESYIIHEDSAEWRFADALVAKAKEDVRGRLIYDWMGGFGKTSRSFWNHLRAGGVEVRCYNRPRFDSPLGWLSRDHRKMLSVDGQVGFITGLCVGRMWEGIPEQKIEPWRDTGVEVRGKAVADIERAFAQVWAMMGEPIPESEVVSSDVLDPAGHVCLRVVASVPAGLLRVDQLVAALARKRLWLTDAYYAGTTTYVQGLRAAAQDGVDVRLLVPNGTDIPLLRPLSRAGYRPLLEAGVRVCSSGTARCCMRKLLSPTDSGHAWALSEIVIFISKAGTDRSTCTFIQRNHHEKIIIKAAAVIAYHIAWLNLRDSKLGHELSGPVFTISAEVSRYILFMVTETTAASPAVRLYATQ
jgi:phosphatidylserine/phosphatidylglycerophosphate/cardiolipin synthase-like enzyme